jgi:hypothetical protein
VQELPNLIVVLHLELESRPCNALIEAKRTIVQVRFDLLQLVDRKTRCLGRFRKVGRRQVKVDALRRLYEIAVKVLAGPLDSVLDDVWK